MKLQDVILKTIAKKWNYSDASEIAGVSVPKLAWMLQDFRRLGYTGTVLYRSGRLVRDRVPLAARANSRSVSLRAAIHGTSVSPRPGRETRHSSQPGLAESRTFRSRFNSSCTRTQPPNITRPQGSGEPPSVPWVFQEARLRAQFGYPRSTWLTKKNQLRNPALLLRSWRLS